MVSLVAAATLLAGAANLALLPVLWGARDRPGGRWFLAVIAVQAYWGLVYGAALAVTAPGLRLALEVATWLGPIWIGVPYLGFALAYTGRTHLLDRPWFKLVVGFAVVSTLLVATNPLHHLVWRGFAVDPVLGAATVTYAHGWWVYVQYAVTFALASTGVFVLLDTVASYGPRYRAQSVAIALTPLPPAAAFTLWAFQIGPVWQLNLTPLAFLPHLVLDAYALFRRDLFTFHPATRRVAERAAIDDLGTPVLVADEAGRTVTLNDAAAAITGADKPAAFGRPVQTLLSDLSWPPEDDDQPVEALVGGERRTYAVAATPLTDGRGEAVGVTVALEDVTDERRRRQRLDVLNRVLRHNLRNDLGVVRSYAASAAAATDDEAVAELLEPVESATDDLLALGERARQAERHLDGSPSPESVELQPLLAAVVEDTRSDFPGATLSLECSAGLSVTADRAALRVLAENLVENAAEHAGEAPTVAVSAERTDTGTVIRFVDDGPGIPDIELDALAAGGEDPLAHGSGLGLWVASWLADRIGARLDFETGADGTLATVTLPD